MSDSQNKFYNKGETPFEEIPKLKEFNYCCSECSSLIEIVSINENNIEFKCLNQNNPHERTITIKEYLEKRKQNKINFSNINSDICNEHNKKYVCYCLECNKHLCNKCLKNGNRIHISHPKINNIETEPIDNEIEILEKIIDYYNEKVDNLSKNNISKIKQLKDMSNIKKEEINNKHNKKIKDNKDWKEIELKKNRDKFLEDIKEIKDKYEIEFKKIKYEYEKNNNKIHHEYKLKEDKINCIYFQKKLNFEKKIKDITNKNKLTKKIENLTNLNKLNELVYNTFIEYKENIFNAINISHIIINSYENSENIKNKLIKNIMNNEHNKINDIYGKLTELKKVFIQKEPYKKKEMRKVRVVGKRVNPNIIVNSNINTHVYSVNNELDNFLSAKNSDARLNINININPKCNISYRRRDRNFNNNNINNNNNILLCNEDQSIKDKKKYDNLFLLFNYIFFKNEKQTLIKSEKIGDERLELLQQKYFKYKNDKKENILIAYFDSFVRCNVLKFFEKKYLDTTIIENIKYNIELILECFELNKNKYNSFYYPNRKNDGLRNRKKSEEAAKRFRKEFNIDSSIINEESLLKRLDTNENDINKVFMTMYG